MDKNEEIYPQTYSRISIIVLFMVWISIMLFYSILYALFDLNSKYCGAAVPNSREAVFSIMSALRIFSSTTTIVLDSLSRGQFLFMCLSLLLCHDHLLVQYRLHVLGSKIPVFLTNVVVLVGQ